MSMEQQMSGYEDTRVNSANQMQMQLADRHGEDILKFIETHAEEFRTLVEAHPEFLEEYQTAPEETLKKIEPLLYH